MTDVLVATVGGHLGELLALHDRIVGLDEHLWVTSDHPHSRNLLRDEPVRFVPFVGARDFVGVLKAIPQAWSLFSEVAPTRVLSTGSAMALAYLPVAAVRRIPAHYIESITRVEAPSITGRILARVPGVQVWWQHDDPPPGWRSLSGILHQFGTEAAPSATPIERIVVTIGTTEFGFRRLVERVAQIVPPGVDVFWQTGSTDVADLGIEAHGVVAGDELQRRIEQADVLITHAGSGSITQALAAGKVPVYVPRLHARGEHVDDHQSELASLARRRNLAVVVDASELSWEHVEAAAARRVTASGPAPIDLEAAPC